LVIGAGVLLWSNAADKRASAENRAKWEAEEKKRGPGGSFDAKDFDATARWLAGQQVAMIEAEDRRNAMATKEAKLTMLHTLASLEGKPGQWNVSVGAVSDNRLFAESFYTFKKNGKELHVRIHLGDGILEPFAPHSVGFAIGDRAAISKEDARRLKAKGKVTVSGTISRCYAEDKYPDRWMFYVNLSEATIK